MPAAWGSYIFEWEKEKVDVNTIKSEKLFSSATTPKYDTPDIYKINVKVTRNFLWWGLEEKTKTFNVIVQKPSFLKKISITSLAPKNPQQVEVIYQLLDQDGDPIKIANLVPKEDITDVKFLCDAKEIKYNDKTGMVLYSKGTDSNGIFPDSPLGPGDRINKYSYYIGSQTQTIYFEINKKRYNVRKNYILFSSTEPRVIIKEVVP